MSVTDSPEAIRRAQFSLDHQPDSSPYWESSAGQEDLDIIADHDLTATTTADYSQAWYDAQMAESRAALDGGFSDKQAEAEEPHYCTCCGEECENGRDCCSDDFPERGDIEETGR